MTAASGTPPRRARRHGRHWLHLERAELTQEQGPWKFVTAAACECGWESEWFYSAAVAVDTGTAHSAEFDARPALWQETQPTGPVAT